MHLTVKAISLPIINCSNLNKTCKPVPGPKKNQQENCLCTLFSLAIYGLPGG